MKSIVYISILLFSISTLAQKPRAERMKQNFTSEQQTELQSKRMVLALDLNEKQLEQIKTLELKKAKNREANRMQRETQQKAGEKPSSDERFAFQTKRLDDQIAYQKEMQKILSEEQYKKWEELKKKQHMHRMGKRKAHKKTHQTKSQGPKRF